MDNNNRHVNMSSDTEDLRSAGTAFSKSSANCSTEEKSDMNRGPTTPAKRQTKALRYSEGAKPGGAGDILTPRGGEWEQVFEDDYNHIQSNPKTSLQSASQVRLIILGVFPFIISLVLIIVIVIKILC